MAAHRLCEANIRGEFTAEGLHPYTNATGSIDFWRIRARQANGEKWIRPMRVRGMIYELKEPDFIDGKKPLYRLHEVAAASESGRPIWFVEGENVADALSKVGLLASTSGGATSDERADFTSLQGRLVVLWPDNDRPGRQFMNRVAVKLRALGCVVEVIDIDALGLSEGGDAVDYIADHAAVTAEELMALPRTHEASTESDETSDKFAIESEIQRMALLSEVDYELQRRPVAARLGLRATILDKAVAAKRRSSDNGQGSCLLFERVDPAAVSVPLSDLLDSIRSLYLTHVVLPPSAADAATLWTAMTWATAFIDCAPILLLKSPEPRCGKSTLLALLDKLVYRPLPVANVSPAALFRVVEAERPTLLIDEGDAFLSGNDELRGVINAGHTRATAYVLRTVGDDHQPRKFNVFGPKALALIGKAPHTITDRSIPIELRRKLAHERVLKLRDASKGQIAALQSGLARWAIDQGDRLAIARPDVPPDLNDRAGDSWAPLLAVADLAGGEWPARARDAAILLSADSAAEASSTGIELLVDISAIFKRLGVDRIAGADLLRELLADEERPWATFNRGSPMSRVQLARRLSNFCITSGSVRLPDQRTPKGYKLESFNDAFARYLPCAPAECATPSQTSNGAGLSGVSNCHTDTLLQSAEPPHVSTRAVCGDVALLNPLSDTDDALMEKF